MSVVAGIAGVVRGCFHAQKEGYEGAGGGWRSYCDHSGAATVTNGALNLTPYKGIAAVAVVAGGGAVRDVLPVVSQGRREEGSGVARKGRAVMILLVNALLARFVC